MNQLSRRAAYLLYGSRDAGLTPEEILATANREAHTIAHEEAERVGRGVESKVLVYGAGAGAVAAVVLHFATRFLSRR
jgi:hypothetical protein